MNNDVRKLNYRWFSKSFWKYLRAYFALALLVIICDSIVELYHGERFRMEDLAIIITMSTCLYFFHRQMKIAESVLNVYQDRISIHQNGKDDVYFFKNVTTIKMSQWGPIRLILKFEGADSVDISSGFERREYVLEALHAFNPKIISPEEFHLYRNSLIETDHKLARFYSGPSNVFYAFTTVALFIAAFALTYLKQKNYIIIHSPPYYLFKYLKIGIMAWAVLYLTGAKFFKKKVTFKFTAQFSKDSSNKTRDIKFENHLIKSIRLIQFSAAAIILIAVYGVDLNLYDFTWVDSKERIPDRLETGAHIYDMKFNCLKCEHSLKKLDIVVLNDHTIAQVIALPGEETTLKEQHQSSSRQIAGLISVPHTNLAVSLHGGEIIELIEESQIIGKIIR